MNKVYPKFVANALNTLIGSGGVPDSTPDLFFYALTAAYVYDDSHETLADVLVPYRIAKSKVIATGGITDLGGFTMTPVSDAFLSATLTDVSGMVLYAEYADDSTLLIAYFNVWVNTGLPFTAPAQVNINFPDDFVFRLGNVGPEA